ncbi:MAG TPA: hypothetical protein VFV23_01825 [Verrucomicrobiae bacterium]|nr:hypothetical protein [Verrucomicrobiae bacterium]
MKNKSEIIKRPSPERLKRLEEMANRFHGAFPNFMANGRLEKIRGEWDERKNQIKFRRNEIFVEPKSK